MVNSIAYPITAQLRGQLIQTIANRLGQRVQPVLQRHGLDNVQADGWYPQQDYLKAIEDLAQDHEDIVFDLIAIGIDMALESEFPPEINTLEKALFSLDELYHRNNRNAGGGWQVKKNRPHNLTCVSSTPMPPDLEYGLLYGLTERFGRKGYIYHVVHDSKAPRRLEGGLTCTYHVFWGRCGKNRT